MSPDLNRGISLIMNLYETSGLNGELMLLAFICVRKISHDAFPLLPNVYLTGLHRPLGGSATMATMAG